MVIKIGKYIVRERQKYIVPARYSSYTYCAVYKDGERVSKFPVTRFGTFNKCVAAVKKHYGDSVTYEVDNKVSYVQYQ